MPKKLDPALKDRARRMVAEHRADYGSTTAVAKAVADQLGIGKETVRRWVVQADIDAGDRPGTTSEESAEIRRLKAENRRLREDMRSQGNAVEPTCRVLTEHGCAAAARTYRSWRQANLPVATRTMTEPWSSTRSWPSAGPRRFSTAGGR